MTDGGALPGETPSPKGWARGGRLVRRVLLVLFLPPLVYFLAAEAAMRIPVNAQAEPLAGTISVYLRVGGPHVDVWVPVKHPLKDWTRVLPADTRTTPWGYLSFGWGDRAFYTEVPEWKDLTLSVALAGAFLPTPSAMRVVSRAGWPKPGPLVHLLKLDEAGYLRLCDYIERSFQLNEEGSLIPIDFPGYDAGMDDRFFEGRGRYHMFRTCNVWTNGAIQAAGKRAALWAPLTRGVRYQLPPNQGSEGR